MAQLTEGRSQAPRLGAWLEGGSTVRWRVWAPGHKGVDVVLYDAEDRVLRKVPLTAEADGCFGAALPDLGEGARYKLSVDGGDPFPDPWSRSQPKGVHGPSEVVSSDHGWTDSQWKGPDPRAMVIYEVHVGTATPEGTFEAFIPKLAHLRELGVNTLELLPLASFPGARNWGYDGVDLFAPQATYGGPKGLRKLIDAAHAHGLAVLIDAVYNHFGPDGNYLRAYSPHYFTGKHHTPWGDAVNYDSEGSRFVRSLVLSNVEMWIRDYHADGLRLDAAHALVDDGQPHLLAEIVERAHAAASGRRVVVIAEDERNERKLVTPAAEGGYGLDGVWADDLHHQLRRAFAGDHEGYYQDYTGSAEDLAATLRQGWFYTGQKSKNLGHARGTDPKGLGPWHFVHCIQNHDQVGNRPFGNRLSEDVSPAAYRAMSTLLLLSPFTPLLFMGQEWNARTPFLYFTDHNAELGKLVTEGRRKEFAGFSRFKGEEVPDPQARDTFTRSTLDWGELDGADAAGVHLLYKELLRLRATEPVLTSREGTHDARALGPDAFVLERRAQGDTLLIFVNLKGSLVHTLPPRASVGIVAWSENPRYGGTVEGSPLTGNVLRLEGPSAAVVKLRE
ncbi:malto-oligosyltrehalose trehalohydrolase [Corallococcus aberystwythensis]|uniref:Malto-oligosyltrehalose trehalohydrolase n=1 Tax=Corallococcus aberystwythensis TaxID=2316722 RepID=A0A3A8QAZ2_9BACT|nr:malto-oligosyltrehalose trehalohydrolase [Corallococcus aberystwythensis]RKH65843.1 malto-oligosyltrehalose trehalohydrolase [Corallococcus aberystwythensis]